MREIFGHNSESLFREDLLANTKKIDPQNAAAPATASPAWRKNNKTSNVSIPNIKYRNKAYKINYFRGAP